MRVELLRLMNRVWNEGFFPKNWKLGEIKIFLKDESRDHQLIKSYRPITLLPVLGKIAERLIALRLREFLEASEFFGPNQFGFTKRKCTIDALWELKCRVKNSVEHYVVGVFLDISGAFDNAWWPLILYNLKMAGCPGELFRIIKNFLSERVAVLWLGNEESVKTLTKGCPQGSVLGPILWNVLFEDFLRMATGEGTSLIAYADDVVLLVEGGSRNELEERGRNAIGSIEEWSRMAKLVFSSEKSQLIMLKGKFARWREPVFRLKT